MARIPSRLPRSSSGPRFIGTAPGQVAIPDFLAPVADGLGQIADVMAAKAADEREEADRVEFARRTTDFELRVNHELEQSIDAYDGSSPGFYESQLEIYDRELEAEIAAAPERIRGDLEARLRGTPRARYGVAASSAESSATRAFTGRTIVETVNRTQNAILSSPASFRSALETVEDLAAPLPPSLRADFISSTEAAYTSAYLSARLRDNPAALRAELNSGALDDVVSPDDKNSFLNSAESEIRRIERERTTAMNQAANAEEATVRHALDDADDALENGLRPATSFAELMVRAENIATADGQRLAERAAEGQALSDFSHEFARLPLAQAQDMLRDERARLADGASGFEARRVELGERILANMQTRLRDDPIAYAGNLGFDVGDLDTSSAEGLRSTLPRRRSQSEGVARHFGVPGRILTDDEVTAISAGLEGGRLRRPDVAAAVVGTMGENAPAVLAEIAPQEPMLAHMGGLMLEGADAAARDLERGLALREQEGFSSRLAPVNTRQGIASTELGALSVRSPQTTQTIMAAADAIYEARALRQGWDRDDFDTDEYRRALNEAAGGSYINGVQFGGLADYDPRGVAASPARFVPLVGAAFARSSGQGDPHRVVVPSWLRADRFGDVVEAIATRDIENPQVLMYDANGGDIPREALARAQLQTIGDGRYLVVFGAGNEAALNAGGQPYVLDLGSFEDEIRRQQPGWVR